MASGVRLRWKVGADRASGSGCSWRPAGEDTVLGRDVVHWVAAALHGTVPYVTADMPTTLGYCRLPDGSCLLIRAGEAVGADTADVVRFAEGAADFAPHRAVAAWDADAWRALPPPGSPVPDLVVGRGDDSALIEFASGVGATRIAAFLADVRALFADPAGRQIVVAAREPADVARWIDLAAASLPPQLASALTFVTWTLEPRSAPHQIVGVTADAAAEKYETLERAGYRVHLPHTAARAGSDDWAELVGDLWGQGIPPVSLHRDGGGGDPFATAALFEGALDESVTLRPGVFRDTLAMWANDRGTFSRLTSAQHRALKRHFGDQAAPVAPPVPAAPPTVPASALVDVASISPGPQSRRPGPSAYDLATVHKMLHNLVTRRSVTIPARPASVIPANRTEHRELANRFGRQLGELTRDLLRYSTRSWSPYAELLCALDTGPPEAQDGRTMLPKLGPVITAIAETLAQSLLAHPTEESDAVAELTNRLDAWDMRNRVLAALLRAADDGRIHTLLKYADSPTARSFLTPAPPTDMRPSRKLLSRLLAYGIDTGAGKLKVPIAVSMFTDDLRALGAVSYLGPLDRWLDAKVAHGLAATSGVELPGALVDAWRFRGNNTVLCMYATWQTAEENREPLIARIVAQPNKLIFYFEAWSRATFPAPPGMQHEMDQWQHARDNLLSMVLGNAVRRLDHDTYARILANSGYPSLTSWMKLYAPPPPYTPSDTAVPGPTRPERRTPPRA